MRVSDDNDEKRLATPPKSSKLRREEKLDSNKRQETVRLLVVIGGLSSTGVYGVPESRTLRKCSWGGGGQEKKDTLKVTG